MASAGRIITRERLELIGDALLTTAATSAAVTGLTALIAAPTGVPRQGMEWVAAAGSIITMLVVAATPIMVWLMHGRRLSWRAVLGGALGAVSAGPVFMALAAVSMLLGLVAEPLTGLEFAGPLALLAMAALAFIGAAAWLVVAAIRDLRSARPAHRHIDILRILSVVVLAAFLVGTGWWVATHPMDESAEAPVFAMLFGLSGALAVTGAEALTLLLPSGGAKPGSGEVPAGSAPRRAEQ